MRKQQHVVVNVVVTYRNQHSMKWKGSLMRTQLGCPCLHKLASKWQVEVPVSGHSNFGSTVFNSRRSPHVTQKVLHH